MVAKKSRKHAKKKPSKHKITSKRDFLRRMLRIKGDYSISKLDMIVIHEIFSWYPEDIDFMEKVSAPPFPINNILWFKTEDGKKYLHKKKLEFYFKIPKYEKPVDTGEKFGDDVLERKPRTTREFLNGC
jgi:hypothetical protein